MASTWLKSAIFYEVYPNAFYDSNGDGYGDFKGITQKLDYIKSLGANAIWLGPHYDSPFRDGGYDIRDYFKPAERFGTLEEFDEFIKTAHSKGIKVILDLVPGHTSEENPDFAESAKNTPNPMYDRYIWTKSEWDFPEGFRAISGRYDRKGNYVVNFFSTQPALNYGFNRIDDPSWQMPYTSDAALKTREWLKSVMRFWLDRGLDGFRVDMADSLVKNDGDKSEKPATSEIWRDIRAMLDREYPDAVLVSEWSDPQAINAGFHADFMLDHGGNPYNRLLRGSACSTEYFGGEESITGYFDPAPSGDAERFAADFNEWYEKVKSNDGYIALITGNHDTPRLAPYFSADTVKLIFATLFTLPGVPFIYYGDELGMKYIKDMPSVECGFARTGSRTPMQWSAGKNAGFSTADKTIIPATVDKAINVEAETKDKKSLLNFVKELAAFRKSRREFIERDFEFLHAVGVEPLAYRRGKSTVIVNPKSTKSTVPVVLPPKAKVLFSVGKTAKIKKTGIDVPPMSFTVFETV